MPTPYVLAAAGDRLDADARRFATVAAPRSADLAAVVRAAERMPPARRRAAFRAVGRETTRIETDLLTHLGVNT